MVGFAGATAIEVSVGVVDGGVVVVDEPTQLPCSTATIIKTASRAPIFAV
jgi:hypothetical protein